MKIFKYLAKFKENFDYLMLRIIYIKLIKNRQGDNLNQVPNKIKDMNPDEDNDNKSKEDNQLLENKEPINIHDHNDFLKAYFENLNGGLLEGNNNNKEIKE